MFPENVPETNYFTFAFLFFALACGAGALFPSLEGWSLECHPKRQWLRRAWSLRYILLITLIVIGIGCVIAGWQHAEYRSYTKATPCRVASFYSQAVTLRKTLSNIGLYDFLQPLPHLQVYQ